jgi:hypothetical protein
VSTWDGELEHQASPIEGFPQTVTVCLPPPTYYRFPVGYSDRIKGPQTLRCRQPVQPHLMALLQVSSRLVGYKAAHTVMGHDCMISWTRERVSGSPDLRLKRRKAVIFCNRYVLSPILGCGVQDSHRILRQAISLKLR